MRRATATPVRMWVQPVFAERESEAAQADPQNSESVDFVAVLLVAGM